MIEEKSVKKMIVYEGYEARGFAPVPLVGERLLH
jgi:hypothetical protein